MENAESLKSRIQILETLLASKDKEIENLKTTLNEVVNMKASTAPVAPAHNKGLRLIPDSHLAMMGDQTVSLTAREFVILNHLHENKEKACTREELLENFKDAPDMTARNIDVHVFSLRKKLGKLNVGVETVWGVGYKINA